MPHPAHPAQGNIPELTELTLRGIILGALITILFTASNVYLGLKVGLTFSSAIPAAVISMAVLRLLGSGNILENNMVQTQASASGTLSSVIFILPGLVMIGHWQGFPYWQTFGICAAGGMLGVLFTIPLRRVMVVNSDLPYPEGLAAAEILRVGNADAGSDEMRQGMRDIGIGSLVSAVVALLSGGFRLLSEGLNVWVSAGSAIFRLPLGFSLALLGAGYLIGIVAGMAVLIGVIICWGFAVPILSVLTPAPTGITNAAYAASLWGSQVRFMGAGTIGIAAIWTLITLFKPMLSGVRELLGNRHDAYAGALRPLPERDLSVRAIVIIGVVLIAVLTLVFALFLIDAKLSLPLLFGLVAISILFSCVFGFLVAAACGYMAGLVGSSSSPISGIGIIAMVLVSLLLLASGSIDELLATPGASRVPIALAIFITTAIIAMAAIANDNLQDLKTGLLVGATPYRQQIALLIGCVVGAAVISPILDLLYNAYGFVGALPREGMDVSHALAAPQATLMTAIATGIFTHALNWNMILIGMLIGVILIVIDVLLERRQSRYRLPALAVGLGIYLPPTVGMALVAGALLAWGLQRYLAKRRAAGDHAVVARIERRGVLITSGLIVGESIMGVVLAAVIGASGRDDPLALVGPGFENMTQWLALLVFAIVITWFVRRLIRTRV
ncbi:oligopeptide transporter, OPT family [Herbaspirillum sp. RTI4]|uniref:OPT family oligopeptide transporter n=1 Tax=Herbaspirillum sp. RTI4 TaxID=3048640 RepID=UPI002AB3CFF5|nr:oligopeptide transporter, OPT family [Herbaspirillum sp. RTI4]MDY7578945.1 oligopeptide transporter, OPT family [Herbaspirillum sp. RTI4]MEA9982034.1 oligopeptide transporter, OPT family [Herbaspirillum sp. RTI4]